MQLEDLILCSQTRGSLGGTGCGHSPGEKGMLKRLCQDVGEGASGRGHLGLLVSLSFGLWFLVPSRQVPSWYLGWRQQA